ncbi:acyl carrier protein [Bacillus atrophaeus]|uniref:acyl carrier protein n=1 Tax=Bacillus atrophaeus TaxID=1452 RepID=UPI00227E791A|nr:acyl carrier protein [Bacillus atrophaeus]MCY8935161.1 acyl carrier protein [Bacillus atrophaeus]MCY8943299.1 acyl carrier protein [Bacillus atrophaeus]MCY8948214.1 acyl carrier protein [Bacillus atrophaeus]
MDIKLKIKAFLSRFFRKRELLDNEDIFELGFVNSLFAMQLVMFIEKEFSIRIDNQDMDMENFRSVTKIAELIERKSA